MNSFRKFTAALAALAVTMTSVFTFSVAVAATTFTDASGIASWALNSVTSLADTGVLSGRPDGSFDPQGQLNRAEVAKVATLAAGLTEDTTGAPHFNDVASADWFYSYVETLYNNGVVGGINGGALDSNGLATYNPSGTLNRAEGSKILVDAFDLETSYSGTPPNFPDVASSAWFYDYAETAFAHGIVNGYSNGNFGPGDAITREQIAVIAQSGVDEAADSSKRRSDYTAGAASSVEPSETPVTPTTPVSDGDLTVAISASSPAAQTFPYEAASVTVAAYDFTATSDDVVITNLLIKRTGVGADAGWTLYIYDGADRLTSGKTINSTSHEATFTGVNVTVAAGTTKTLSLRADTAATSTGVSYFEISSATAVTSNAQSVGGSFPVVSNKQEVDANIQAGGITITKTGSITDPKVGEDNVTIAKFNLETAREAGLINQISFVVDGTISATDVQNAKLYQGTTLLASTAAVNSKDLLVFSLDTPFTIEKGDSRNFEVKADFNTGRGSDTVKIYLDEDTDLMASGGTYGFGMSVDSDDADGYDNSADDGTDASHSTLQGGDITITKSTSSPTAGDIAVNSKDVVLLEFGIASVSEVTFKKFGISLTTNDTAVASDAGGLLSGTTSNYTDIKIINRDTGAVLMGPIDASAMGNASGTTTAISGTATTTAGDSDGFYIFQDEFTMAAGEELNLAITVDIANNTGADFIDDTIYASLDINGGATVLEIKDVNNKTITTSTSVVPTTDIDGNAMSIKKATLTVTKSSTPVSDTAVKGTQGVSLIGLTVAAGAASDVKITEMLVRLYADAGTTFDNGEGDATNVNDLASNFELWVGDTKIAGPEGLSLVGTLGSNGGYQKATFDNMDYTIDAGATVQFVVKGDLSSNAAAAYIAADITPSSDITAEDADGNTVTAAGTAALNNSAAALGMSPMLTISTGGSLTVAVDADTTKENIVVAGTSDVEISKFRFTTTDEAFKVTKLSINNRQSAATTAAMGDYDNNVVSVKLSYTNSSGATETKSGYLTAGTANFSGLDMLIDKDDDAVLTVSATLLTVAAGATAGEFVDLNIAFNDFEAVAQGSGETYTISKIDAGSLALSIGAISYTTVGIVSLPYDTQTANFVVAQTLTGGTSGATGTIAADVDGGTTGTLSLTGVTGTFADNETVTCGGSGSAAVNSAAQAVTLGSSATITVADQNISLPVGTIVKIDDVILALTTKYTDGDTTMVSVVADNGDGGIGAAGVTYALPGTGYLTASNQMVVYESKPTIALASSSPSGSRTTAASDGIFIFTISADAQEKIQLRAGLQNAADSATTWAGYDNTPLAVVAAEEATVKVQGTKSILFTPASGQILTSAYYGGGTATTDLSGYTNVSFWARATEAATTAQVSFVISETASNRLDTATDTVALSSALVADTWSFQDLTLSTTTTTRDLSTAYGLVITGGIVADDLLYIDDLRFYNEKLTIDLASDGSMCANMTASASVIEAFLKEGGTTVATGYVSAADAGACSSTSEASAASITFVPVGTYNAIEISKGTPKTFTVQLDTTDLMYDSSGTDDLLTVSIDLGTSTAGSVTAGGLWWNETNATVKWLGQVSNTTLNGSTLKY